MNVKHLLFSVLIVGLMAGCLQPISPPVQVKAIALSKPSACSGQFVAHDLPHVTAETVERIAYFISNGAGLAVNDLDQDGDMDLVLGNLFGPTHIFWNEGHWQFRPEVLFEGSTRAVTTVDVDGDGRLDILLSTRIGRVRYWRNTGDLHTPFVEARLPDVRSYAYAIQWGDLDLDGDLDLVTASYDASLEKQLGKEALRASNRAGVYVYRNQNGRFVSTRLADAAQALALLLLDLDQDGRLDILVGNDFDVPDQVWLTRANGWVPATPFSTTTHSTMSFEAGDINNDGQWELFAADMHPYAATPDIMRQWQPVLDTMPHHLPPDDPQKMENVLQVRTAINQFTNTAAQWGVPASGWSWSAKFGDLNQDGFSDLYVVNGMAALELFRHLPNDELVEENQAYRNDGQGRFVPAPEWHLNSRYGGRSMSMADLDGDGDLDIVINNLRAPAQVWENQLCQGTSLLVDLRWPNSRNTYALGSILTLKTSAGSYTREVRAASGYLSGDPAQVHFGIPSDTTIYSLLIEWPDGRLSVVNRPPIHHRLQITRLPVQREKSE